MNTRQKKQLLIIGGGYAGISLIHKLKNNEYLKITLLDMNEKHLLQTHIHKYLSGHYSQEDITFNHKEFCKQNNINFIHDEVININYSKNYVFTRQNKLINYDFLVIATGSLSIFPAKIDNILEYTKDIKKIENLDYYRDKFFKLVNSKPSNKNIVVVGGGISGLQIACEYAYHIKSKGFDSDNIQVTIIEGLDSILPGMDPFLIQKANERCEELGIKIITGQFASKIYDDKVVLSNNVDISYDILLFVIGATGNYIINSDENIIKNQRNQLVVDDYYKVIPYKNVFAIGDIAQAKDIKTNNFQAPTAQASRMQAELTAKNIIRMLKNKPLISNYISNKGVLIDLGGPNCAIGKILNINLWGKPALWLKKLIYALHSKKFN